MFPRPSPGGASDGPTLLDLCRYDVTPGLVADQSEHVVHVVVGDKGVTLAATVAIRVAAGPDRDRRSCPSALRVG
jgi:hypothetical protein